MARLEQPRGGKGTQFSKPGLEPPHPTPPGERSGGSSRACVHSAQAAGCFLASISGELELPRGWKEMSHPQVAGLLSPWRKNEGHGFLSTQLTLSQKSGARSPEHSLSGPPLPPVP